MGRAGHLITAGAALIGLMIGAAPVLALIIRRELNL